jgi:hypothetical protein
MVGRRAGPVAAGRVGTAGRCLHVHTMYRDPTNDYGRAFTKK